MNRLRTLLHRHPTLIPDTALTLLALAGVAAVVILAVTS